MYNFLMAAPTSEDEPGEGLAKQRWPLPSARRSGRVREVWEALALFLPRTSEPLSLAECPRAVELRLQATQWVRSAGRGQR